MMPTKNPTMTLTHDPKLRIPFAWRVASPVFMRNTYFPQVDCHGQRCTACIQIHSPRHHGGSVTQTLLPQHFLHKIHKYHIPSHLAKGREIQYILEKFPNCTAFFLKSNLCVLDIFNFLTCMNYLTDSSLISHLWQVSRQNDYFKV